MRDQCSAGAAMIRRRPWVGIALWLLVMAAALGGGTIFLLKWHSATAAADQFASAPLCRGHTTGNCVRYTQVSAVGTDIEHSGAKSSSIRYLVTVLLPNERTLD